MLEDLRDEVMAEGVGTIARRYQRNSTSSNDRTIVPSAYQSSQQDHALDYPQPTQGQGLGTVGGRTGRIGQSWNTVEYIFDSRVTIEKHHKASSICSKTL